MPANNRGVYASEDMHRDRHQVPYLKIRGSIIQKVTGDTGKAVDLGMEDLIDNLIEMNFTEEHHGQWNNMNYLFEKSRASPHIHETMMQNYLGVGPVAAPVALQNIMYTGSGGDMTGVENEWINSVANVVMSRTSAEDGAENERKYRREPWKRRSIMDVMNSNVEPDDADNMQEIDVDPGSSGHWNTYYPRSLRDARSREEMRVMEIPSRVTPNLPQKTRIASARDAASSIGNDPEMYFMSQ